MCWSCCLAEEILSRTVNLGRPPLLAQDGLGHFGFRAAQEVFYVDRRDTRDRLQTNAPVWTFVLEAYPAGRIALVQRFGCRVLEDSLEWSPRVSECALREVDRTAWLAQGCHALSLPTFYALSRRRVQGNSMGDASVMKAAHGNHLR